MTFDHAAKSAGFTEEQISFMSEYLAQTGHRHDIEEIEGLGGELAALGLEDDDDDEDEDED